MTQKNNKNHEHQQHSININKNQPKCINIIKNQQESSKINTNQPQSTTINQTYKQINKKLLKTLKSTNIYKKHNNQQKLIKIINK